MSGSGKQLIGVPISIGPVGVPPPSGVTSMIPSGGVALGLLTIGVGVGSLTGVGDAVGAGSVAAVGVRTIPWDDTSGSMVDVCVPRMASKVGNTTS